MAGGGVSFSCYGPPVASTAPSLDRASSDLPVSPLSLYRARQERFVAEAARLAARSGRVANLRLLAFLAGLALLGWGVLAVITPLAAAGGLLFLAFAALVAHHRRLERARRHLAGLAELNAEAAARLARDWAVLPLRHERHGEPDHPYALDLDVLGRASLLHLLEAVGTRMGEATLAGWLLAPTEPAAVRERQAAARELAPLVDWRDELAWRGRGGAPDRPDPEPFLAWAESASWLTPRRGLLWTARISPPLLWLLFAAHLFGQTAFPFWVLPLLVNCVLAALLSGRAGQTIQRVAWQAGAYRAYADGLELAAEAPFEAPILRRLQAVLIEDRLAAPFQLRRLHRIVLFAQPTSSMLYPVVELATLWNVHVLSVLEGWQAAVGPRARAWLAALGEVEALAALGRLAHDQPAWTFPDVDPAAERLAARELGHPLLRDEVRVCNDVAVGPPGTFLLVTGSNMAGKSTLLRAIGLNAVLAQAGGPVCAAALRMPPLRLWTSMRVQDSLEQGVSYFMAELRRLKRIVDAAEAATAAGGPPLLHLLDEILQGTNTAERQIAARRVVRLLLARRALGAVSTHDLTLAEADDLAAAARPVHLAETVADHPEGPAMTFDYRLRPGIARSTNALRLLELVGLPAR